MTSPEPSALHLEANKIVDRFLSSLDNTELARLAANETPNPTSGRVRTAILAQLIRRLQQHQDRHLAAHPDLEAR